MGRLHLGGTGLRPPWVPSGAAPSNGQPRPRGPRRGRSWVHGWAFSVTHHGPGGEGPPCFPHWGLLGAGQLVADHRSEQRTPSSSPGGARPSVTEVQVQLTHLQEEGTGPKRGSDWPQVTQPACGGAKLGARPSAPGWSLGVSLVSGKFSRSSRHFQTQREALNTGFMPRLGPLRSSAAPSFYSRGALGLLGLSL